MSALGCKDQHIFSLRDTINATKTIKTDEINENRSVVSNRKLKTPVLAPQCNRTSTQSL
jgi:hypothetical protein